MRFFLWAEGSVRLRKRDLPERLRVVVDIISAGVDLQAHGVIFPVHQRQGFLHGCSQRPVSRGVANIVMDPGDGMIPSPGLLRLREIVVQIDAISGLRKAPGLLRKVGI